MLVKEMSVQLSPTMENYLEVIRKLSQEGEVVRVKTLARELKVKMPSVSEALKVLRNDGLIAHEKYGYVELTARGSKVAEEIFSRHQVLFAFLTKVLGIDPATANEDACKMEHVISSTTLSKLIGFVKKPPGKKQGVKECVSG